MYIQTPEMRNEFIRGLRNRYARNLPGKSIANKADIMYAAVNLYAYGTPFVNRGAKQPHYGSRQIPTLEIVLDNYVTKIWEYFNVNTAPISQGDFDNIHKDFCDTFLAGITRYSHTYGNAQKMTNVLFKYLACFRDADVYADRFEFCHMALDRYTYNGYRLPFYSQVVYPAIHSRKAPPLGAWSGIAEHSQYIAVANDIANYVSRAPKTYNQYLDICARFPIFTALPRLAPKDDYVLTPFEAEFFLWGIAKACAKKGSNKEYIYPISFVNTIKSLI